MHLLFIQKLSSEDAFNNNFIYLKQKVKEKAKMAVILSLLNEQLCG